MARADKRRQGEGHEQCFLNKIPAVINCGRRDGHQPGGDQLRPAAERGRERRQQEDRHGAGEGGHQPDGGFGQGGERVLAAQPGDREYRVVERGTVVIGGIIDVGSVLEEFTGLDRLIGFVRVHRPPREIARAKPKRDEPDEGEGNPALNQREQNE